MKPNKFPASLTIFSLFFVAVAFVKYVVKGTEESFATFAMVVPFVVVAF
jgi:hypothetical protein